ncbi:MAG: hypothetical protein ACXAB4_01720 [Candidatus Hodarchaeales archaeon]
MSQNEFSGHGEVAVMQDAKALVQELLVLAQQLHSFSSVIKALILQARLAIVDNDLLTAVEFLERARRTAKEKHLGALAKKISAEKQHLEIQYEKWQIIANRNISFHEWLKQTGLDDYLKEALKLVRMSYKCPLQLQ